MNNSPRQNLTHQLTHDLGIAIVKGVYPVGEGLPSEADLCIEYDVSRSSTREAVKMLSAKGLISSRPKQGIRVLPESNWNMFDTDVLKWILSSKPSLSLLKEFTQVRVALEPQAAALAAMNASDEQLASIEKALERMVEAEQGLDDPLEADIAFHTSILIASGNRFFVQLTEFIGTALRVSIRYTNKIKGVPGADVKKHAEIFNAIKARNPELSKAAVSMILDEALELIELKL
ncbi:MULTISPECIES: FadR/GntR family transcriptional regulator [unclassified Shewanella]|mgnify:CR=1 FL=1|jgi:DNA-binding FadR family transcriptional regulator|uniref:FadR/GntR family transcriptional regulator n=1 Tax=unclassified Shewanella TaxID=196818 RepID=UPI000C333A27|nr:MULTISPECIES: FadR/GntR family transcriptional regulator [unclassified Shewanella]MBB1364039.1 FadR family transcriptional regulator [Shewanella sp. SR44-4]MBO1898491.1 FadR family transcriptional regulator [Shewanella sp. BF02_Schw]PKH31219.1 FadR family transcriptional regulator [Shewanella sp. ALD9]QHS15368.1 FadR family transcriptional regulator [Shewanella sp. Arc9-LZ]|tara:strand:+ start:401 stop:1099 length:699 start_codon:yes stop_codon:yes gene_type:complete